MFLEVAVLDEIVNFCNVSLLFFPLFTDRHKDDTLKYDQNYQQMSSKQ